MITDNGRSAVSSDPDGKDFPWYPQPLEELSEVCQLDIRSKRPVLTLTKTNYVKNAIYLFLQSTAQTVNEHACLIAFTDGSEATVNHVKSILKVDDLNASC